MKKNIKNYHKNPRYLTKINAERLEVSMERLGDISGIVHDKNTNEIIGGNQRSNIIDINTAKIEIIKQYNEPTKTGTLAIGYVHWKGERFNYRLVDWDAERIELACLLANKNAGNWDKDILANQFDDETLLAAGFDEKEIFLDDDSSLDDNENEPSKTYSYKLDFSYEGERIDFEKMLDEKGFNYTCKIKKVAK